MKKHYLITLTIPVLALASCAPVTPELAPTAPIHKQIAQTITKPKITPPPNTKQIAPKITPTHGIPGQPC